MKQMTFADAEYAGKRKQTRKELFLIETDRVVPWKGLISLDYAIGWGLDNRWVVGVGGVTFISKLRMIGRTVSVSKIIRAARLPLVPRLLPLIEN